MNKFLLGMLIFQSCSIATELKSDNDKYGKTTNQKMITYQGDTCRFLYSDESLYMYQKLLDPKIDILINDSKNKDLQVEILDDLARLTISDIYQFDTFTDWFIDATTTRRSIDSWYAMIDRNNLDRSNYDILYLRAKKYDEKTYQLMNHLYKDLSMKIPDSE